MKPKNNEQRIMISSPSRFVGDYSREDFFIDIIFPINDNISFQQSIYENPYCRNFYVIGFSFLYASDSQGNFLFPSSSEDLKYFFPFQ